MSVATFVIPAVPEVQADDLIVYDCMECQTKVPATESDSHAAKKHKASMIRVFHSPRVYQDFLDQEKIRAALKEIS